MGNHLRDLKVFENDTVVQAWVNLQLQSDLDRLGIGLISNRTEPATTTTSSSNSSSTTFATASITQGKMFSLFLLQLTIKLTSTTDVNKR